MKFFSLSSIVSRYRNAPVFAVMLGLSSLALLSACDGDRPGAADGAAALPMTATDAQCTTFAENLERYVHAGDTLALTAMIDRDMVTRRIVQGLVLSTKDREELGQELSGMPAFLAGVLVNLAQDGSSFRFLRVRREDGQVRALFRKVNRDGLLDYMQFLLATDSSGGVRIADWYMQADDMWGAARSRSVLLLRHPDIAGTSKQTADSTPGGRWADSLSELVIRDQNAEALAYYETIPEPARRAWPVQMRRIRAAAAVGDSARLVALHQAHDLFAGQERFLLQDVRYFLAARQMDSALVAISKLDAYVGGDPYLDAVRAWAHGLHEDDGNALSLLEKAIAYDSTVTFSWNLLFWIQIRQHNHAAAVRAFDALAQRLGAAYMRDWVSGVGEVEEFLRSNEYQAYLKRQPAPQVN